MARNALVTSAVPGILTGAACGGTPERPTTAATAGTAPTSDKTGCGNHEPGKCASTDGKPASAAASDGALSVARTETVAPGKAVEVNLSFSSPKQAKATFKASAPVAWNVHSHPAGGVVEHQKGNGTTGELAFHAPAPGVYSFMWTNEGSAPVTLEVSVSADPGVVEAHR